jgi:hypothetical protein
MLGNLVSPVYPFGVTVSNNPTSENQYGIGDFGFHGSLLSPITAIYFLKLLLYTLKVNNSIASAS